MNKVHKILLRVGLALGALTMAGSAQASNFVDLEPNDTFATAQHLIHDGSINLAGFAAPGGTGFADDVSVIHDWFRIDAVAGDALVLKAIDLSSSRFSSAVLHLWSGAGAFLAKKDATLIDPEIAFNIVSSGTYFVGVGDFGDNGPLDYQLIVTGLTPSLTAAVPEPATWAMMIIGFGAVGGAMRRKRNTPALA